MILYCNRQREETRTILCGHGMFGFFRLQCPHTWPHTKYNNGLILLGIEKKFEIGLSKWNEIHSRFLCLKFADRDTSPFKRVRNNYGLSLPVKRVRKRFRLFKFYDFYEVSQWNRLMDYSRNYGNIFLCVSPSTFSYINFILIAKWLDNKTSYIF